MEVSTCLVISCSVGGTDAVKFAREDLEHHKREAELTQTCANIGTFEGSLGCADFNKFLGCEDYGASSMEAETVAI